MMGRRMSKCQELSNSSGAYLQTVSEKMTAKFIHPILLLKHLNAKLETVISICEVLFNRHQLIFSKLKKTP